VSFFGSLVIPPVLDLLNKASASPERPAWANMRRSATGGVISALAKGVLGGDISWNLIGWGALLASHDHFGRDARKTGRCGCRRYASAWASTSDGADLFISVAP